MKRLLASIAALALLSSPAMAANLTPDQLTQATTINNSNLLLLYPTGGPMQSVQWSVMKSLMQTALGTAYLQVSNNLNDLASPSSARNNLGLGTAATLNSGTSGGVLGLLNGVNLYSAEQFFQASSTSSASINLGPGVAPTSPINGDLWTTSAAPFVRINGVTQQLGFALGFTPVNRAGDTITGGLTVNQNINIANTVASGTRGLTFDTGLASPLLRWVIQADQSAETGGNAGSILDICRFSDAGGFLDCPVTVNRATGNVSFSDGITATVTGNVTGTSSLASAAVALQTARTISLTGAVTATCPAFNGSANISCATTLVGGPTVAEFNEAEANGSGSGTGSVSASSWAVETLNNVIGNSITGASCCTSNQFTLPAGTYQIRGYAVIRAGTGTQAVARLRDISSGGVWMGTPVGFAPGTLNTIAPFSATFFIPSAHTFDINIWSGALGSGGFPASTGANEIYSDVQIEKVG